MQDQRELTPEEFAALEQAAQIKNLEKQAELTSSAHEDEDFDAEWKKMNSGVPGFPLVPNRLPRQMPLIVCGEFAKQSCNKCFGRGHVTAISTGNPKVPVRRQADGKLNATRHNQLCGCVSRRYDRLDAAARDDLWARVKLICKEGWIREKQQRAAAAVAGVEKKDV